MKIQRYGSKLSLYKTNQLWRENRAKHNQRDFNINQTMNREIFGSMINFTYGQNSLIIKQATMRTLKSI